MSLHSTPASASAACAATTPYSTKLRPHLPHGCMPVPSTTISRSLFMRLRPPALERPCDYESWSGPPDLRLARGRPLPHDVLVLVVLVERAEHELHRHADFELLGVGAGRELPEYHHLLSLELDGAHRVGDERVGRHVRLGRRVVVRGPRPQPAPSGQRRGLAGLARL